MECVILKCTFYTVGETQEKDLQANFAFFPGLIAFFTGIDRKAAEQMTAILCR
jgi:hypothetical protein